MKQVLYTVTGNRELAPGVWEMSLAGDTSPITAPGQFVDILLPGKFLRRPVSVCNWTENRLLLLVKEAGEGTKELVRLPQEMELDILTGLGSGFDYAPETVGPNPALAGGGIGIAPLYGLAKRMKAAGQNPTVIRGFVRKRTPFMWMNLRPWACRLSLPRRTAAWERKAL